MNKFTERFKELLQLRGYTQYAFAKKLNLPESTVANWFHGRSEPNYDMLLTICKELNESPNYILGYED